MVLFHSTKMHEYSSFSMLQTRLTGIISVRERREDIFIRGSGSEEIYKVVACQFLAREVGAGLPGDD